MLGENELYYGIFFVGNVIISLLFLSFFIKKKCLKFSVILLTLIIVPLLLSIRESSIALDAPKYINLFKQGSISKFFMDGIYDWGYILFNLFLNLFTDNYNVLLFILAFLHIFLIIFLYNKLQYNYSTLLLAMYFSTFVFWISNLSMLRQGIAIPILAIAIYYLIFDEKKMLFFILSSLASFFHYSAFFVAIFVFSIYLIFYRFSLSKKKFLGFIFILLILYPGNLFMGIIFNIIHLISPYTYNSTILEKIVWYFTWDKFKVWHIKHVYYLILFLLIFLFYKEKNDNVILLALLLLAFLGLLKYDEMVTDRIFMYFVPFIPYFVYRTFEIYPLILSIRRNHVLVKNIALFLLFACILTWFNIKLMYLQYSGWFIYPYSNVR